MFNQDRKEKFINECSKTKLARSLTFSLFNASEEYENKYNHDICDMTKEEMSDMVSSLKGLQGKTAVQKICILKEYEQWCIDEKLTPNRSVSVIDGITADDVGIANIKQQMVATPQELQKQLNIYFAPEDKNGVDNLYRAYFWLAFSGIAQEDVLKIKNSNIDIKNMCVNFGQEFYPIYKEEVDCLRNGVILREFNNMNPNYKDARQTRVVSEFLFRGTRGVFNTNTLRMTVSRRIKIVNEKEKGVKLSYNRIWLSGVFYRMYEREQLGFPVNFKPLVEGIVATKEYDFTNTKSTNGSVIGKKEKEFKDTYYRWKLAFHK